MRYIFFFIDSLKTAHKAPPVQENVKALLPLAMYSLHPYRFTDVNLCFV